MDTSKEYIKMCEKAKEIYEWCYETFGKYIIPEYSFYIRPCDSNEVKIKLPKSDIGNCIIWLPRQDQLQEMVKLSDCVMDALCDVSNLMKDNWKYYGFNFTSMEQLWLAFVMKEKFNKQWNGEDWI